MAVAAPVARATGVTSLSAATIAAGVRDGTLDPVDVVRAHLARIDELEPRIGALSAVRREEALREAEALRTDARRESLPLAGVPVGVKENMNVAGLATSHGSRALPQSAAPRDDELVARVRRAGGIVLAKTHMPELAIWPVTEGRVCNTRNPLAPWRTAGGSSGGSGAAVASGMVAAALGSDGGGSIRIPAACCGIVGVKTTAGLLPLPGDASSHWHGLSVTGPLARDVTDAALLLGVLANDDTYSTFTPPSSPLRVTLSWRHPMFGASLDREHRAAVVAVGAALRREGHDVTHDDPPYTVHALHFLRCWLVGVADEADELGLDVAQLEPATAAIVRGGRAMRRLHRGRQAQTFPTARGLQRWMDERDVVVSPVLAGPPPEVGRWWGMRWQLMLHESGNWMGYAPPWNLAGCPAIAVPVARDGGGMSIAVQLIGRPGSERLLLGAAARVMSLLPV